MKSSSSDSDDEDKFISTIVGVSEPAVFRVDAVFLPFPIAVTVDFRAVLADFAFVDVDFAFPALAFFGFDVADIQPSPSDIASGFEGNFLEDPACFC